MATTPLGSGRGRQPSLLALFGKSYASGERGLGSEVIYQFGDLPEKDPSGRHGHLVGFDIEAVLNYDVNATSLSAAIDGARLLAIFQNIKLQAGGVPYFGDSIDGRHLRMDYIRRNGTFAIDDPADIADTTADDSTITVNCRYYFGSHGRPKALMDGAIPLAMLDHRVDSNDVLRFSLQTSAGFNITGFTLNSVDTLVVTPLIAYTEDPYQDAAWYLDEKRTTNNVWEIEPRDPSRPTIIEHATVHALHEDGADAAFTTEYAGTWNVRHGDFDYTRGSRTTAEMKRQQRVTEEVDWVDDRSSKGNGDLDQHVAILPCRPWTNRSDMAAPPIYCTISQNPANVTTRRTLHRQVYEHAQAWRNESARRTNREGAAAVLPGPTVDVSPKLLPRRIVKDPGILNALARKK